MTIFIMSVCLSVCLSPSSALNLHWAVIHDATISCYMVGGLWSWPIGSTHWFKMMYKTFVNTAKLERVMPPCLKVTSHLGDKPSWRQSSRRQTNSATTNSATLVGRLGDNLFRLSVQELATLLNCRVPPFFIWGPLDSVQLFSAFTTQY